MDGLYVAAFSVPPTKAGTDEKQRRIIEILLWFGLSLIISLCVQDVLYAITFVGGLAALFIFFYPGKQTLNAEGKCSILRSWILHPRCILIGSSSWPIRGLMHRCCYYWQVLLLCYIKQTDSILACSCSVVDHRCQIVVRSDCASCCTSLFLLHFDLISDLLLNRCMVTWYLFVKWWRLSKSCRHYEEILQILSG